MHAVLYVLVPKEGIQDSREARAYVSDWLISEGFVADEGRFSRGVADWFVIGGERSGELTLCQLDGEERERFERERDKRDHDIMLRENGYEDDAQIVNETIYKKIIEGNLGREDFYKDGCVISTDYDLEGAEKPEDIIGKAWIVVVDFHY